MADGKSIVVAARALVGTPFRLHGRDPATGLDCVGLVLSALKHADYKGTFGKVPSRYSLRGGDRENIGTLFEASGLRSVAVPQPGDCVLVQAGVAQFHLMIVTDGGHVHAHAGLGRVVEMPGPSPWPVEGYWSVRA